MPGKRKDTVGSYASKGCTRCCGYCRASPLAAAVCYGGVFLGLVIVIVYFASAGLTQPARDVNAPGQCSPNVTSFVILDNRVEYYRKYLEFSGIAVIIALIAVFMCCCVGCGLFCPCPRGLKIAAIVVSIPAIILFGVYMAWLGIGTFLLVEMDSRIISVAICRNILVIMVFLYLMFLSILIFAFIVCLWKTCSGRGKSSGGKAGKKDQLLANVI